MPEALRVLRPGGALALWWNTEALDVEWIAEAAERTGRLLGPGFTTAERRRNIERTERADPSGRLDFARRTVRWSRRVPVDVRLASLGSHSALLVESEVRRNAFMEEERAHLLRAFPDGTVEETYDVRLLVALKP